MIPNTFILFVSGRFDVVLRLFFSLLRFHFSPRQKNTPAYGFILTVGISRRSTPFDFCQLTTINIFPHSNA
jgi:hypothetical protein